MYFFIETLRELLVDFFRDCDKAFGVSPIPPTRDNKRHQVDVALFSVARFLCENIDLFEDELKKYPLRKDVNDLGTVMKYVLDNFHEPWGLHDYKFFEDYPLEDCLKQLYITIEKVINHVSQ